jgi:hypothetical protein
MEHYRKMIDGNHKMQNTVEKWKIIEHRSKMANSITT